MSHSALKKPVHFGEHWSFNIRNDPKRLAFVLARYKFAADLGTSNRSILELGCSEGIGAPLLAEKALSYTGVDIDPEAIVAADQNLSQKSFRFICDDFMGKSYGFFECVVSLDVVEHILPEYENLYFDTVFKNLSEDGIAVIGTPNITASPYASKASELGHVNLYSQERLVGKLREYFYHVFPFGMNDEMVHTGYAPMCHYLMCLCCHKREPT